MNYSDKTILITGGATGIGRCIAETYHQKGATVIVADKDSEKGKKLEHQYDNLIFYAINLAHGKAIPEMFTYLYDTMPNILINNAGLSWFKPLLELKEEEWDEILATNLKAAFLCSREFIKHRQGTDYGRIINIASTRALMSEPNSEAYAASKGGIAALTHALALSASDENITVNCISPGWIQTTNYENLSSKAHKQHPSGRIGKPEDIARLCLYLTDEENDFINGENIVIDGGMTHKMIYEA